MTTTMTSIPAGTHPPTVTASIPSAFAPAKGTRTRYGRWAVLIAVFALAAAGVSWAALYWNRAAAQIANVEMFGVRPRAFAVVLKEKGELKAAKSTDITCEVEGRSTIITLIPEGAAVEKGDLLIELASDEIVNRIREEELKETNAITAFEAAKTELDIQRDQNDSDIRKADLKIELAQLELEKYAKGDWEQTLKDAQIAIDQARISLDRRTEDFDAAKELREKNFITKTEYDEDYFNFRRAEWELEKAHKAMEVLNQYTHVADLRQRESDHQEAVKEKDRVVKNAEAEETKKLRSVEGKQKELELIQDQLAKLRSQKEKCRIVAPTQGFVVYYTGEGGHHFMSSDSQIKEGATVHERQVLLSLPDTSAMLVAIRVHETKTDKLRLGQRAVVNVEGLPGHEFTGMVTKIAVVADSQNRWLNPDLKEYQTEVTLDPTDVPLKPGVTAHTEILVETVEDKLAIPVQTVYAKAGHRYVFCEDGREVVPREVVLGAIGTEWAEVVDGLTDGEQVLLAFNDDHKRLIPDQPEGPELPQPFRAAFPGGPAGSDRPEARQGQVRFRVGESPGHSDDDAAGADSERRPAGEPHAEHARTEGQRPSGGDRGEGAAAPRSEAEGRDGSGGASKAP